MLKAIFIKTLALILLLMSSWAHAQTAGMAVQGHFDTRGMTRDSVHPINGEWFVFPGEELSAAAILQRLQSPQYQVRLAKTGQSLNSIVTSNLPEVATFAFYADQLQPGIWAFGESAAYSAFSYDMLCEGKYDLDAEKIETMT